MKGMKLSWSLIRIKYSECLFCKFFKNDFCSKWYLPRGPVSNQCTKFKRNYLFRENSLKKRTFRLIFSLYFMMYFCIGIIPPNINNIIKTVSNISEFQISLAIAFNLFINSFSVMIFGYFGDRMSEKSSMKVMFILTNALWIFGYGCLSFSPNYVFFLSLLTISAIGTGAFIPLGFSMVGELFHAKIRGKKFGIMQFGLILGNGLGIMMGITFSNIFNQNGWRMAYLFAVILNLLILSAYSLIAIQPERGSMDSEFANFPRIINYNYRITKAHLFQLANTKSIIGILLSVLCGGIATSTLANWGILFLTLKFGNSTLAAMTYLIVGTAALPGAVIGGKISDYFFNIKKRKKRFLISMMSILIGSISLLGFYLIHISYWVLVLPLGFIGYFFTSFNSGTQY
ncbi:MAG: MFS transporter, partial [Candidatus Hermodarchaeota archaeon]